VRHATGLVQSMRLTAAKRRWTCEVDGTNRHGATRAAFCQSGKRTLWWSARRR